MQTRGVSFLIAMVTRIRTTKSAYIQCAAVSSTIPSLLFAHDPSDRTDRSDQCYSCRLRFRQRRRACLPHPPFSGSARGPSGISPFAPSSRNRPSRRRCTCTRGPQASAWPSRTWLMASPDGERLRQREYLFPLDQLYRVISGEGTRHDRLGMADQESRFLTGAHQVLHARHAQSVVPRGHADEADGIAYAARVGVFKARMLQARDSPQQFEREIRRHQLSVARVQDDHILAVGRQRILLARLDREFAL